MAKAELKTKETTACVSAFIDKQPMAVAADRRTLIKLMKKASGEEPKMWGASMIGSGCYHYKSKSGREGEWMVTGSRPRKTALPLYIFTGFDKEAALMKRLGEHSTGVGCLYIKQLADVDMKLLEDLIVKGWKVIAKPRVR